MSASMDQTANTPRVLLCVGGGIAAYKSLEVVRRLRFAGAQVQVVMTEGAQHFVTPVSFQALSGHLVRTSLWDASAEAAMGHIELARWADQIIVAPATADLLAKFAHGLATDLVTTLYLATTAPIWVAPAMNQCMWRHPATQANIGILRQRGVRVIGPGHGPLAEEESGPGRMSEPEEIVRMVLKARNSARESNDLAGKRIVITAGPTYEDVDPVRYLGNRSSGKMGFALAASAAQRGAEVVLVAGPVHLVSPVGVRRIDVRSAAQMRDAVLAAMPADVYIGAAAVADYTPQLLSQQKLKKAAVGDEWTLTLIRTPDILSEVARRENTGLKLVVGFAAETENIEQYAKQKLVSKHLDLVIANQVGIPDSGFESDASTLTAYWHGGEKKYGRKLKTDLADAVIDLILERLSV